MHALTLSGPGALLSVRDNATKCTSSHITVLDQVQGGLCISIDSSKKLVEFICDGFQIFWINLPLLGFERERAINYLPLRTQIFPMQSRFFEGMVSLSFKKGFLNQVVRFFCISPVNGIPCLMKSFEEAICTCRFHEILDFLVDKTTGPATNLNGFLGSMNV